MSMMMMVNMQIMVYDGILRIMCNALCTVYADDDDVDDDDVLCMRYDR